jgi:hypothetical protein
MQKLVVSLGFSEFPPHLTCNGGNRSPLLSLRDVRSASLAVIAVNPFEPCCSFASWLVWNIEPADTIPEGIPPLPVVTYPIHAVQGTNDYGKIGYAAPCPKEGSMIRYAFKVYGLEGHLDLPAGSAKEAFFHAIRGHVLQYGDTFAMARR